MLNSFKLITITIMLTFIMGFVSDVYYQNLLYEGRISAQETEFGNLATTSGESSWYSTDTTSADGGTSIGNPIAMMGEVIVTGKHHLRIPL